MALYKKFILILDHHPLIGIISSWFGSALLFITMLEILKYAGFIIGLLIGVITLYEKVRNNYKNWKNDLRDFKKKLIK